jgi:hypothetical protein
MISTFQKSNDDALDVYVSGTRCVYCGLKLTPAFPRSKTSLCWDHFIPRCLIGAIRQYHAPLQQNHLLPCCTTCNELAGAYMFFSARDRIDFVRSRRIPETDVPETPEVNSLALEQFFRPIEELSPTLHSTIVVCPARLQPNVWGYSERVLPLCSLEIYLSRASKTAFSPSRDTSRV